MSEEPQHLSELVIGAAMEVHRQLGPGLLESAYQRAMEIELSLRGIPFRPQLACKVDYKGHELGEAYRIDLLVADTLIVELKSISEIEDVHVAQVLTYLKCSHCRVGLIVNFHKRLLKDGLRRLSL